jgi:proline dehydrogenase
MRGLLLWMAHNRWLGQHVPRLAFVRRAVRRFMPGEDPEDALRAAMAFKQLGIASEFTRLGENITTIKEADEVAEHYLGMADRIATAGLDGEISVKLTQLGLDIDEARAQTHVERLADRLAAHGAIVWIDMEGSAYTERTIMLYERVMATRANVGLCLQAYLRRTAGDLQRLLPLVPGVRLVKGAYAEPAAIAFERRSEVSTSFVALAVALLHAKRADPRVRIGLGTHDVELVEQIAASARSFGLGKDAFEVQMLYGIRDDQQRRLAREGLPVRDLIGYGTAWYPWYMRRLAERPANVVFALRQLLP